MLPALQLYIDDVARSASINMALDEVFWHSALTPRLRFYQWDHPALSFGYFGRYADVAEYERNREIVRRCTGGGIVLHGADLTYALVIPRSTFADVEAGPSTYAFVHRAMQSVLSQTGITANLLADSIRNIEGRDSTGPCFANPVTADLLVGDLKIAGAAQRRSRRGLLQQGSIQSVELPPDFPERFAATLSSNVLECRIDSDTLAKAAELALDKYATEAWLKRR